MVENQFNRKVKCLKSDNGTGNKKYGNKKLLEELGILHTRSNVYTSQQNRGIEREMRTVVESAQSAIHAQNLNDNLWAEAINYAIFTINQTGTSSLKGKSPAELWFGRKMDIKKLRSFGCECYVLIQNHKRVKTEKKSKKGIFVGYDLDSPCYRIYLPDDKDVVCSDNVFNEKVEKGDTEIELPLTEYKSENSGSESESSEFENSNTDDSDYDQQPDNLDQNKISDDLSDSSYSNQPVHTNLRDRRTLKPSIRFGDYILGYFRGENNANVAMIGEVEDISVSDALQDENWRKAMSEEFSSLIKMKTWNLIKPSKQISLLTCRWILRRK